MGTNLCKLAIAFLSLVLLSTASIARGRGGPVTTFDVNLYGGVWTCLRTQASGACGSGPFAQYFDAVCDGNHSTEDETARRVWISYGAGFGAAQAKLYMPPVGRCSFDTNASMTVDANTSPPTFIQNSIVWAYSASTVNVINIGSNSNIDERDASTVFINTLNPGDTVATTADSLVNFSVGDDVVVTGLAIQTSGHPSNPFYFNYRTIVAKGATTLTLSSPVTYTFLSTWPRGNIDLRYIGGPAAIQRMLPEWNQTTQIFGLNVGTGPDPVFAGFGGAKTVVLAGVTMPNAWSMTASQSIFVSNSFLGVPEVDKILSLLTIDRSSFNGFVMQTASSGVFNLSNSWVYGQSNGTPGFFNVTNTRFDRLMHVGPDASGATTSIILDGVYLAPDNVLAPHVLQGDLVTFSSGSFTTPTGSLGDQIGQAVLTPGFKMVFADHNCQNIGSPQTTFTVTGVSTVGGNTVWTTTLPPSYPSVTCGGDGFCSYCPWGALTITERNSQVGSASISAFQAPP